jgi:hypothetical protein
MGRCALLFAAFLRNGVGLVVVSKVKTLEQFKTLHSSAEPGVVHVLPIELLRPEGLLSIPAHQSRPSHRLLSVLVHCHVLPILASWHSIPDFDGLGPWRIGCDILAVPKTSHVGTRGCKGGFMQPLSG